jgi:hypothetical protein
VLWSNYIAWVSLRREAWFNGVLRLALCCDAVQLQLHKLVNILRNVLRLISAITSTYTHAANKTTPHHRMYDPVSPEQLPAATQYNQRKHSSTQQ